MDKHKRVVLELDVADEACILLISVCDADGNELAEIDWQLE